MASPWDKYSKAGGSAAPVKGKPWTKYSADSYLDDDDLVETPDGREIIEDTDPRAGLAIPGTASRFEAEGGDVSLRPTQRFGTSRGDTLNPLPLIAAGADRAVGALPIVGERLQGIRDQINADTYGDTPADARADIDEAARQNPEAALVGTVAGKTAPFLAAAAVGGPLAGALGLEGSLGLRMLMGGLSSEALNVGDRSARGEPPLEAMIGGTSDTLAGLPFYAFGGAGKKAAKINSAATTKDLKIAADPLYRAAEDSGVLFAQPAVADFVHTAASKAISKGLDETLTKQAVAAVKRLENKAASNMTMADAMTLRKVLGNAAQKSLDTTDADHAIAVGLLHDFDTFLENATKAGPGGAANMAVLAGDAGAAHQALVEANQLWSKAAKGEMLDKALEKAIATSKTKDIPLDRAIRDRFGALEQQIIDGNLPGFSPAEVKIIQDVAHGEGAYKIAATLGKARSGGIGGISGAVGSGAMAGHFASGGDMTSAALGGGIAGGLAALGAPVGMAGRSIARNTLKGDAQVAAASVRGRALGGAPLPNSLSASGRFATALPTSVGRAVATMTLKEWSNSGAPAQ